MVKLADALRSSTVFTDGDWVESKDQDPDGDVRLVQMADVGDGRYLNRSARFLTSDTAARLKCTFLQPGDLLVSRMPEPLGRCCIFPGDEKPCVTVVDVCVIRPDTEVFHPRWLMHCLNSPGSRRQIEQFATGTTRARVSRGNLGKISIPLPPLDEQRRIAATLDQADAVWAKRREADSQIAELSQSIFMDMFGSPISNPMRWELSPIGDVGRVSTGKTPPTSDSEAFGGPVPFVTPGDLEVIGPTARSLSASGAAKSRTVRKGATLVCCIGATIGKVGRAAVMSAFNQQINAVEWGPRVLDGFGFQLMRLMKPEVVMLGSSTTMPLLPKSKFEKLVVPVPPKELQEEYGDKVEHLAAVGDQSRVASVAAAELFHSLRSRAFTGQL